MCKFFGIRLACIFLIFSLPSYAQIRVKDDPSQTMRKIGKDVEYLEDMTASLTLDDILSTEYQRKFIKHDQEVFNRPANKSAFWFKITIQKQGNQDLWLEIGEANITWYADFYAPNQQGKYGKPHLLGGLRPQKNRKFPTQSYCVLLFAQQDQGTQTYYLRLQTGFSSLYIFQIGNHMALIKHRKSHENAAIGFIGLMLGLLLYNLFLLYSTREKLYFLYVLYLMITTFFVPFLNGYLIIYHPWLFEYFMVWNGLVALIITLFVMQYFKGYRQTAKGWVYWIWAITIFQSFVLPFVNLLHLLHFSTLLNIASLSSSFYMLNLLLFGLVMWYKGFKRGGYYLLAWFCVISSTIIYLASHNGIFPINYFVRNILYIGFASEALLFALALGSRLNLLKAEKELAQKENLAILNQQNELLEERVLQRTKELQEANEEMQVVNEELRQTQEELETQRDFLDDYNQQLDQAVKKNEKNLETLHKQNKKLDVQNNKINSSMKAAETIQRVILPQKESLQQSFQEYFILNQPRDVVSGDFYWLDKVGKKTILVVADCTGHGVPGALMTLVGVNALDKIIKMFGVHSPAMILNRLHEEIQTLLKQKYTGNNNGMDAVVVTLEETSGEVLVTFSGAKNSVFYFLNERLYELKGTRKSIGGIQNESTHFTEQQVVLPKDTMLYLGSDGLEDQNDKKRKKFGKKRLMHLLTKIASLPIIEQKLNLEESLKQHKRGAEQRDDILWLGVKI